MLILSSSRKFPIGHKGIGMWDGHRNWHGSQPWVVLREATEQEYKEFNRKMKTQGTPAENYYEVSTD